jgi:hypothetical protein
MNDLGCSDGGCLFRNNTGQVVTNGGCNCVNNRASYAASCWAIPLGQVRIMLAQAVQVALEKERANNRICANAQDAVVGEAQKCSDADVIVEEYRSAGRGVNESYDMVRVSLPKWKWRDMQRNNNRITEQESP